MTDDDLDFMDLLPKHVEVPKSATYPTGQVQVKEMFLYTKMKVYPDGSIFLEIKGRPKDMIQKPKKAPKANKKIVLQTVESH
jgi:allantoicase